MLINLLNTLTSRGHILRSGSRIWTQFILLERQDDEYQSPLIYSIIPIYKIKIQSPFKKEIN
jgi:tRNA splicing endonuclease